MWLELSQTDEQIDDIYSASLCVVVVVGDTKLIWMNEIKSSHNQVFTKMLKCQGRS